MEKTTESNHENTNSHPELTLEISVIMEEYKTLREEIISLQEFTRQNITTTYAGIGVLGAITPFIVERNLQLVFLIFPMFFFSLALTSTKYALAGLNIGDYLKTNIIPQLRESLLRENIVEDSSHIFAWEEEKGLVRKYGILYLPANGAHYWIILFSALICIGAYFAFPPNPSPTNEIVGIILLINAVAFIYTFAMGLIAGYSR